jgi:hypothetical protein
MALSKIIKFLDSELGVVEMVVECEEPSRLRIELTSEAAAELFSLKAKLIEECWTTIRGSVVVVEERD